MLLAPVAARRRRRLGPWVVATAGVAAVAAIVIGLLGLGGSIRLGAPTAVERTPNGNPVAPPSTTPVNVVVTAAGVHPAP